MGSSLKPIADRLGKLLRMLSSDRDGEVIGAARAIMRILHAENLDIHALAGAVESMRPSEADMRKVYDAGFADGKRSAETRTPAFADVVDASNWLQIGEFCRDQDDRLNEKERTFVRDVMGRVVWREPSEKQQKWLLSIFYRLGGKHT